MEMNNIKRQIPNIELLKIGVDAIQYMMNKCDKWKDTFDDMFDGFPVVKFYDEPISAIIKMLEEAYHDVSDKTYGSMLSWWIYEADMGRKTDFADSVIDTETGKKIPMRTIEDLYNYYVDMNGGK